LKTRSRVCEINYFGFRFLFLIQSSPFACGGPAACRLNIKAESSACFKLRKLRTRSEGCRGPRRPLPPACPGRKPGMKGEIYHIRPESVHTSMRLVVDQCAEPALSHSTTESSRRDAGNSTSAGGAAEGSQGQAALRAAPGTIRRTQPRPERARLASPNNALLYSVAEFQHLASFFLRPFRRPIVINITKGQRGSAPGYLLPRLRR